MSEAQHTEVTIIGAGISGLSTAYFLTRAGLDVRLLEKSDRTGGTIETERVDGFLIDYGPNSGLETTPLLAELFEGAGVASELCYASDLAKNRYIVKDGRLNALPMSPGAFLRTRLFSARAKLRLLKEPFIAAGDPSDDESLADFVRRRLGTEFLDYAINPFVSGVYAGVPEQLSVRSSFPKLHELEQRYGSLIKGAIKGAKERKRRKRRGEQSRAAARMFSFTGGMQTVTDGLSRALADRITTGAVPAAIDKEDGGFVVHVGAPSGSYAVHSKALVFAIPAYAYSGIEFGFRFDVAETLHRIPYPPVSVVFFGYRDNPSPVPLDGFGFLIPQKENRGSLGTIWSSTLFPDRAPTGGVSLTTFVGGSRQPQNARLAEEAMIELVRRDLKEIVGITNAPDTAVVRLWDRAIPQYNVGHIGTIEALEGFERANPGLHISGNFRGGVSISDCVRHAHELAGRIGGELRAMPAA